MIICCNFSGWIQIDKFKFDFKVLYQKLQSGISTKKLLSIFSEMSLIVLQKNIRTDLQLRDSQMYRKKTMCHTIWNNFPEVRLHSLKLNNKIQVLAHFKAVPGQLLIFRHDKKHKK